MHLIEIRYSKIYLPPTLIIYTLPLLIVQRAWIFWRFGAPIIHLYHINKQTNWKTPAWLKYTQLQNRWCFQIMQLTTCIPLKVVELQLGNMYISYCKQTVCCVHKWNLIHQTTFAVPFQALHTNCGVGCKSTAFCFPYSYTLYVQHRFCTILLIFSAAA